MSFCSMSGSWWNRQRYWALGWLGLAIAIGAWQLLSLGLNSSLFPEFTSTAARAWSLLTGPVLQRDLIPSVLRTLAGFGISAAAGIALGMLVGSHQPTRQWTGALFDFLRSLPTPLLVPVALVLFGLGGRMVIAVIITAAVWPVLINTANATAGLDPTMVDTARMLGLRRFSFFWKVVLPAVSPQIYAGMRIAMSISLAVMVVAEILGGGSGIGYYIANAQQSFDITGSYAGVVLLCLLGWLLDTFFLFTERHLLRWHRGAVGGETA